MLCIKYLINLEEKAIKYPLESIPESTIKQQIVNTNTNLNINKNTETNINKKNEKSDPNPNKIHNTLQTENNNRNFIKNSLSVSSSNSSGESEVKKLLNSEFDRVKTKLVKMENNYNKDNFNSMIKLLKAFCNKNAKNANKNLKVKGKKIYLHKK
jgi:hypothetical protein